MILFVTTLGNPCTCTYAWQAFSACALFSAQSAIAAEDRYIDVTGQGEVEAYPDYLQLNLTVSDTQPTSKAAKAKVAS